MQRRGKPVRGAIFGTLFGLFLGLDLLLLGVVPSDSAAITVLPVLGLLGGLALGITAPLGGRGGPAPVVAPAPAPATTPVSEQEAAGSTDAEG